MKNSKEILYNSLKFNGVNFMARIKVEGEAKEKILNYLTNPTEEQKEGKKRFLKMINEKTEEERSKEMEEIVRRIQLK